MKKKILMVMIAITFVLTALTACNGGNSGSESSDDALGNSRQSMQVDQTIQFGGYNWIVLDVQDDGVLILSENTLPGREYDSGGATTWESSSMREWLNGYFYDNTFATNEKTLINETRLENRNNQWYGTEGGIDTIDKVFLLSLEEVVRYFGDSGQLANRPDNAHRIDDEYNLVRFAQMEETGEASWWRLRSPGHEADYAAIVRGDGSVGVQGACVDEAYGVRPALWLNFEP